MRRTIIAGFLAAFIAYEAEAHETPQAPPPAGAGDVCSWTADAPIDIAAAQLAASCPAIDEECEVGEFQALKGEPTMGAIVKEGQVEIGDAPGWGLSLAR